MPHTASPALLIPHGSPRFVALATLGWALLTGELSLLVFGVSLLAVLACVRSLLRHKAQGRSPSGQVPSVPSSHSTGNLGTEDQLLGIANRAALERRLEEEWRRERHDAEPTALLLIAVDDFAALGDEGGQMASDVALLTLARSLARMLPRRADLLARYDRSSFAVMLPGTDLPGTLRVAARLRWAIVRLGIAHPYAESGFVSASLGIAVQHGLLEGGSLALLAAAESALRKAQSLGSDRLEYTVLEGRDGRELQAQPMLSLPSLRAWTPERETLQHSPQV